MENCDQPIIKMNPVMVKIVQYGQDIDFKKVVNDFFFKILVTFYLLANIQMKFSAQCSSFRAEGATDMLEVKFLCQLCQNYFLCTRQARCQQGKKLT